MTSTTAVLERGAERPLAATNQRVLGTLAMLASPAFIVQPITLPTAEANAAAACLNMVFLLGWVCSAVGMRQLGITNRGLFAVQTTGLVLAFLQEVQDIANGYANHDSVFYRITDAAWPLSVLFMLVIGVMALRSRVWTDWRRFAPLLCGLVLPAGVLARLAGGESLMRLVMAAGFGVAWAVLGYAVRTARPSGH